MSVIFSKSCEYALQAVLYLAKESDHQPILLREISDTLRIPHHFLSKVLQTLARDELIVSYKGANGGFALARPADEIALIDIVRAVDGTAVFDHCLLGFRKCGDQSPCPVHHMWKEAREIVQDMLENKTVADLSGELEPKLALIHRLSRSRMIRRN